MERRFFVLAAHNGDEVSQREIRVRNFPAQEIASIIASLTSPVAAPSMPKRFRAREWLASRCQPVSSSRLDAKGATGSEKGIDEAEQKERSGKDEKEGKDASATGSGIKEASFLSWTQAKNMSVQLCQEVRRRPVSITLDDIAVQLKDDGVPEQATGEPWLECLFRPLSSEASIVWSLDAKTRTGTTSSGMV